MSFTKRRLAKRFTTPCANLDFQRLYRPRRTTEYHRRRRRLKQRYRAFYYRRHVRRRRHGVPSEVTEGQLAAKLLISRRVCLSRRNHARLSSASKSLHSGLSAISSGLLNFKKRPACRATCVSRVGDSASRARRRCARLRALSVKGSCETCCCTAGFGLGVRLNISSAFAALASRPD